MHLSVRSLTTLTAAGAGLLLSLAAPGPLGAQVSPNGGQFQVNQYTTSAQRDPAASTDALGRTVVVWSTPGAAGDEIAGRRYARSGQPLGGQFVANSLTTAAESYPAVAADPTGRFIVAWQSYGSVGNDSSLSSIQARRFSTAGAPAGAQFQVNNVTTDMQVDAAIAATVSGNFVVVWTSEVSAGTDSEGTSIQGRLFGANGSPLAGQFQVNSYTTNDQSKPAVAMDASGNFVVAWESYNSPGSDGDQKSILARRFNASGSPLGTDFQVNSYTTGVQSEPSVTRDPGGNFVISWTSNEATGDADLESIQAQRFAANGSPAGGQFQINQLTTNSQRRSSVSAGATGGFVVAWGSYVESNGDTSASSVRARRFSAGGTALTSEFLVNTYTTSYQDYPVVTADLEGNFFVVWNSFGSNGTDNEGWGIHARRYDSLYRDGFEGGNTSRWSSTVP